MPLCLEISGAVLAALVYDRFKQHLHLRGADLTGSDLIGANLAGANLSGATVTEEQLDRCYSLARATMPDGSEHD